ncbi:hypothetical protein BC937DRAFT_87547 [Endogone sp. FLAS-F59071]|nr:hypothetical protein BC937DRAFT_87547 [Endogone sp. FLAS-F59071]|eukprot:RUS19405.1 hypothetical protein BC937DRAFT_87547 [Endogone sp. FLAS-F59071]
MSYQSSDIEGAEKILKDVLEGVKQTFEIFAGDVDSRRDAFRVSDATFLIHLAALVQNPVPPNESQAVRLEMVVRIIDDPQVTVERVQADVDTGEYLKQWVDAFGSTIYFWGGFDINLENRIPRDKFHLFLQYLHDHPQRHSEIRDALVSLRPERLTIPRALPGGNFKTPYGKLFADVNLFSKS